MSKCKCGAVWRTNYPFGKRSNSQTIFTTVHKKDCIHNKEVKKEDDGQDY